MSDIPSRPPLEEADTTSHKKPQQQLRPLIMMLDKQIARTRNYDNKSNFYRYGATLSRLR